MKINVIKLLVVFGCISIFSCTKETKETIIIEGGKPLRFTIMVNKFDPLIVTGNYGSDVIDFFGERNEDGSVKVINQIMVKKPSDTTIYYLDENGRPIKIYTQNGVEFDFNWLESKVAVLTIISNNGENQINTLIDFNKINLGKSIESVQNTLQNKRVEKNLDLKITPYKNSLSKKGAGSENCVVNVFSCNNLRDANVTVIVKNKQGNRVLGIFPTVKISKGVYGTNIPTNLAPKINPSEICSSIISALDNVCIIEKIPSFPLLCTYISAPVAAAGISAPLAAIIFSACEATTLGITLYCGTLGASPIDGASSVGEEICKSFVSNRAVKEDIIITAKAAAIPYNSYSNYELVSGNGPFPNLNINLGSETSIRNFLLIPPKPAQGISYLAKSEIFCLLTGSTVKLSIKGSDGYSNSISNFITTDQPESTFTLNIPGARSGVKDIVTIEIELPNKKKITRTASLVFS